MAIITIGQALTYAEDAGFTGTGKIIIVAIAIAESGLDTHAWNHHDPYGGSFGILQINGSHFISGTTTRSCAYDPACSFRFAYELSRHGTYFRDWGTYTNGSYKQYLSRVRAASPGSVSDTTTEPNKPTYSPPIPGDVIMIAALVIIMLALVAVVVGISILV